MLVYLPKQMVSPNSLIYLIRRSLYYNLSNAASTRGREKGVGAFSLTAVTILIFLALTALFLKCATLGE
jgi:hypothetical protein